MKAIGGFMLGACTAVVLLLWSMPSAATLPVQHVDAPTTQSVATARERIHTKIGDLNCDGVIDFCDINPFVDALTNEGQYLVDVGYDCAYRGFVTYPFAADCNLDGVVDMADINPFVEILLGAPPPNFVPIIGWSPLQDDPQGRELYDPLTEPSPK